MNIPREVLFKAKRIHDGKWVKGYPVPVRVNTYKKGYELIEKDGINYDELDYYSPSYFSHEIDPTTISQFTGLKDMNGNKIFENDIVYIPAEDGYFHLHWEKDIARFIMENYSDRFSVDFDNYWSHEVEVYGNIFDNRDLLGEE